VANQLGENRHQQNIEINFPRIAGVAGAECQGQGEKRREHAGACKEAEINAIMISAGGRRRRIFFAS
jgi:hypothetical protein